MNASSSGSQTAASQLERLLLLVPWLVQNPGVTAGDTATEFNVSLEQIERDLNLLIVCGLPGGQHGDLIDIQFWADDDYSDAEEDDESTDDDGSESVGRLRADGSIHVLDPQSLARPMALRTDEAVSLLIGLSLLQELPGSVNRELIDQVMAKLQDVAGDAADPLATIRIAAPTMEKSASVREFIDDALTHQRRLTMTYLVPTRDEVTERVVEPQQVVLAHGHLYLRAWCLLAGGERTFRVDRILDAKVVDEPIDPMHVEPDSSTAGQVLTAGIFSAGVEPQMVTLDLSPAGRWIAEYAPVQSQSSLDDGGVRVEIAVADERWIERLVLQAGGNARVVAPHSLAERLAQQSTEALAAYS